MIQPDGYSESKADGGAITLLNAPIRGRAMAETSTKTGKKPATSKSLTPPEERFWQRYSPHYEFPISSVSSLAIHVLIGLTLFLAVMVFGCMGLMSGTAPI